MHEELEVPFKGTGFLDFVFVAGDKLNSGTEPLAGLPPDQVQFGRWEGSGRFRSTNMSLLSTYLASGTVPDPSRAGQGDKGTQPHTSTAVSSNGNRSKWNTGSMRRKRPRQNGGEGEWWRRQAGDLSFPQGRFALPASASALHRKRIPEQNHFTGEKKKIGLYNFLIKL